MQITQICFTLEKEAYEILKPNSQVPSPIEMECSWGRLEDGTGRLRSVQGRENKVWKGRCWYRGRDGQGEGWMKGKSVVFVCPRRGSPSPSPLCVAGSEFSQGATTKKRSRAWKSLELFSAHKLPLFYFISGEGWGDGVWPGALMVYRSTHCSRTKNTIFQISPLFHSMELIFSHLGNSIHHKNKVKKWRATL